MKTAALLVVVAGLLGGASNAEEIVLPPIAPTYHFTITPVKCPDSAKCNTLHARFIRPDGTFAYSQDFPVEEQISNILLEIKLSKGTILIWSDK